MEQNDHHEKSLDLDVTPEGPYADQRPYPPKKKPGYGPVWIGIAVVAVIIIVTFFAFSGGKEAERTTESPASAPVTAGTSETSTPDLPEKAPDAVSFSPSPEMRAEEEAATSQNMVAATSAPVSAVAPNQTRAEEKNSEAKPAEKKPAETKKAAANSKPADTKVAVANSKPADTKVAAADSKPADTKTAAAEAKPETKAADAKPAETVSGASEAKPAEPKSDDAKPAETAYGVSEAKPAETKAADAQTDGAQPAGEGTAETKPAEAVGTEAKPAEVKTEEAAAEAKPAESMAISDKWVVNISSTPDAAESLRVLTQVMARKAAGEDIYAYETTINGVPHHRIRIGFFATRAEAEAVGQRIKDELKLSATPWAVQPNVDEVTKYKK